MRISARNILKGRALQVVEGSVNCEVTLEIAPGIQIVFIITKTSGASLRLKVGSEAFAIVKASSVMIAVE